MIPLTFIILNFIHAIWHSYLIKKNRLIQSNQKVIEYTIGSLLTGVILVTGFGCKLLPLILFCLLTRMAFFDLFLNLLRGKPILYEGHLSKKKSIVDVFESWTGLPIVVLRGLYLAGFIAYTLIYYL